MLEGAIIGGLCSAVYWLIQKRKEKCGKRPSSEKRRGMDVREMEIPREADGMLEATELPDTTGSAALEIAEQQEMDAFVETIDGELEGAEQREMSGLFVDERLGKCETIYAPETAARPGLDWRMERRSGRLGEYRIFGSTRPAGTRYDIFADGR